MPQTWLTKAEAADYAKVSVRTIERAIERGALRAEKPSRRLVRIHRKHLEAWLAGGFAVLVLLFAGLVLACRLGFEPAHDLVAWASRGKMSCLHDGRHRHRRHAGRLYALPAPTYHGRVAARRRTSRSSSSSGSPAD